MPVLSPLRVLLLGEDKYSKEFNKLVKKTARIGDAVSSVGSTMTRGLTVPLGLMGAASIKSSLDLNKAMASVGTLIPGETKLLEDYRSKVMGLAADTGVSSTVISEGLYETISAFGKEADTMAKLTTATKMSKAGLSSVKEALALTSAVTKGYGETSAEAVAKASDLAFLTVKLGQTTFPELAASMGRVVPLAATMKVSQEELFGAMATLTGVTGTAAEVSTQLTSAMGAFIKPSGDMNKAVKKMGYSSSVAMVKELGLAESLKKLGEFTGMDEAKLGKLLTRKEGLNAALALLGPQADNFAKKTQAMGQAAGATDEAYQAQTEGMNKAGHSIAQTAEKVRNMAIKIGDKLLPIVERLVDKLTPLIDKFLSLDDATLETGIQIAGVVAAAGPLLVVLGKTISLVSVLQAAFGPGKGLAGVLGGLGGPTQAASTGLKGLEKTSGSLLGNLKGAFKTAGKIKVPGFGGAPVTAGGVAGAAAGVVGAGLLGWEIGSAIEQKFFAPQNQKVGDLLSQAEGFSTANVKTAEDVAAAGANIDKLRQDLLDNWGGTEVAAGRITSFFTGEEGPDARLTAAMDALTAEQKKLQEKQIQLMEQKVAEAEASVGATEAEAAEWGKDPLVQKYLKEIQEREAKKAEADITVRFEGLPKDATPLVKKNKGGDVKTEKRGAVMQGGL
jgi:TP901 family phage tail tape measure protein